MYRVALLLMVLSAGCATEPYWVKVAEPAREVRVHVVDSMLPHPRYGYALKGMAVRNADGTCDVFVLRHHATECVVAHEKKHCAGFDHPRFNELGVCEDLIPAAAFPFAAGIMRSPQFSWDRK